MPTPAGADALRRDGARAMHDGLRRHLATVLDPSLLPRSFRFADALPFDERGKLAAAAIERLFS